MSGPEKREVQRLIRGIRARIAVLEQTVKFMHEHGYYAGEGRDEDLLEAMDTTAARIADELDDHCEQLGALLCGEA